MPKKLSYLFISPHLDDALLSCGGLISELAPKAELTIATVFTHAHNYPSSLSIRRFLRLSGYGDSEELFALRRQEDKKINSELGVKTIHLGFIDGLYRLIPKCGGLLGQVIPETRFIYPIYSWQLKRGRVSGWDQPLITQIEEELLKLIEPNMVVFAPSAIGNNMDHKIVRLACEKVFPECILWSDFPYNMWRNQYLIEVADSGYKTQKWDNNLSRKVELIKKLKTQMNLLFPDGSVPKVSEYYFFKQEEIPFTSVVRRVKPLAKQD